MTEQTVINGTAEEIDTPAALADEPPYHAPFAGEPTGRELAVRPRRHEVVRPLDADQLVESFEQYQALLPKLLAASDYQSTGTDRDGNEKRFVKKSGWRKIATAFDLDVIRVGGTVGRDENGQPVRAEETWRAIAPSGRTMDGDGYCSVDEERFGKPGDTDWKLAKKRAKLEHDLRSTAATRAKNRAISDLVGMGEVSAEEVDAGGGGPELPWWANEATGERKAKLLADLAVVLHGREDVARGLLVSVKERLGVTPDVLPAFVGGLLATLQQLESSA